MSYSLTIMDWVTIVIGVGLIAALVCTPAPKKKIKGDVPFMVLGQIGRHVAVITAIGPYFKFQVEHHSGEIKKDWLIGVIHPDGELAHYRALEHSVPVDKNTITIKTMIITKD